jgi:membrane protease subunit (stomatin/prohibitin family)
MGYIAGMILSGVAAGATSVVVGRYAARRQYEAMSKKKAQQAQLNQAQTQVAQPQVAPGAQKPNQSKNDTLQELERLGSLKKQGLLTDKEFQEMKTRLISNAK